MQTGARLIEQMRRELDGAPAAHGTFEIPAERYRSEAWLARERAAFANMPRIALPSSAIPTPGSCHPIDMPGASALLVRGADGRARAFYNACKHRGTRLVAAPCTAKAMVCPYHGWTYDLTGALVHVPHPEAFAGIDLGKRNLDELAVTERHGLVWIGGALDQTVGDHLGEIDADLAALDLGTHAIYRSSRITRRCNWKLIIEAFLDGYHIRILHRDSIYRFFIDASSVAEPAGQHIRAITGRRTLRDAASAANDFRTLSTPSFLVFPATVLIVHPDFVSVINVHPLSPNQTDYQHMMLVPADRLGDTAHWDYNWSLIEETVFQREDLWVCEEEQRGIEAGATDHLLFGSLEHAVRWFHASIERSLV